MKHELDNNFWQYVATYVVTMAILLGLLYLVPAIVGFLKPWGNLG